MSHEFLASPWRDASLPRSHETEAEPTASLPGILCRC